MSGSVSVCNFKSEFEVETYSKQSLKRCDSLLNLTEGAEETEPNYIQISKQTGVLQK